MEKLMKALVSFLLAATAAVATPPVNPQSKISPQLLAAAKSLRDKNAPILVEDFTDFQCPRLSSAILEHDLPAD